MLTPDQRRAVENLIRLVGSECIFPYFQNLKTDEVRFKSSPSDPVSIADEEAERQLQTGLQSILPGSLFVGEENCAADPDVLKKLTQSAPVWVVDPIDGTANFVAGRPGFGIMLCLLQNGQTLSSWLYEICSDTLTVGHLGEGVTVNGHPSAKNSPPPILTGMIGWKLYKDPDVQKLMSTQTDFTLVPATDPSIISYTKLLNGTLDFLIYRLTWPWDHLPGLALVSETGGVYERWDGQPHQAVDTHTGLVAARNAEIMNRIQTTLIPLLIRTQAAQAPEFKKYGC